MALATRRNAIKWSDVRSQRFALEAVARAVAGQANTPAGERDHVVLNDAMEAVKWMAGRLALVADSLADDPKPPKGKVKPVEVPAVEVPPLVPDGCPKLHGLAVALAGLAVEAARLGSLKAAAFAPGAMRQLAERVRKLADEGEWPT